MSKDEYYVEPDGDEDPTLWVDGDTAVVSLIDGDGLMVRESRPRHEVAFWNAAVSVLAPDDQIIEDLAEALHASRPDHHAYVDCEAKYKFRVEARAALAALRNRAVSE